MFTSCRCTDSKSVQEFKCYTTAFYKSCEKRSISASQSRISGVSNIHSTEFRAHLIWMRRCGAARWVAGSMAQLVYRAVPSVPIARSLRELNPLPRSRVPCTTRHLGGFIIQMSSFARYSGAKQRSKIELTWLWQKLSGLPLGRFYFLYHVEKGNFYSTVIRGLVWIDTFKGNVYRFQPFHSLCYSFRSRTAAI